MKGKELLETILRDNPDIQNKELAERLINIADLLNLGEAMFKRYPEKFSEENLKKYSDLALAALFSEEKDKKRSYEALAQFLIDIYKSPIDYALN